MSRLGFLFAAGFVLAAMLFGFGASFAQDAPAFPAKTAAYVKNAFVQLETLEKVYVTAKDNYRRDASRRPDEASMKRVRQQYDDLFKTVSADNPPLDMQAFHAQFHFALGKCGNLLSVAESVGDIDQFTMFHDMSFEATRDFCAAQAQDARLRLLDYGIAHGVILTGTGFGLLTTMPYSLTAATSPESTVEQADEQATESTEDIIDEPIFDDVRWTIGGAEDRGDSMVIRDGLKFETSGKFISLSVSLENIGKTPISIDYGRRGELQVLLIDNQEREFAPYETGYSLDELCENIEINPGLSATCLILFEVPANIKGLKLRLAQKDDQGEMSVAELAVNPE